MRNRLLVALLLPWLGCTPLCAGADGPKIGLQRRVAWSTSRITGALEAPPPYRTERIFSALKFREPVTIARMPGTERIIVVELRGRIFSFADDHQCNKADLFADLTKIAGHTQSFGLAFHPRFRENRHVFICYALKPGDPKGERLSRFRVTDTDPPQLDLKSETILIEWRVGGHNGGCLQFGKDGYLYISTGDAAEAHPPDSFDTGQDISDLLASILRIDVDHADAGKHYAIPKDNPFVNLPGARPEVWAYGLRNVWKFSFDPKTGDLWAGDVGWEMWEYLFRIERGGNYGWSVFEGRQPVRPNAKRGPTPILPPIVDHPHTEARSVTGGRFYYGSQLKELHGAYIYGDYVTGKFWGLRYDGQKVSWHKELARSPLQVIDFGEGRNGELYILEHGGTINRLAPNTSAKANPNFPRKLSDTGLFTSVKDYVPAPGVLPYSINAEPWADHAVAERLFAVIGTPKLGTYRTFNPQTGIIRGAWIYPSDTVFAKTMSLEMERGNPASRRRLETQILHRDGPEWRAYNYIWNDQQTDAFLAGSEASDGAFTIKDAAEPTGRRQQTWHFASRTECLICHTTRAGSILGFNLAQLNREHRYGDVPGHQLATMEHLGFFENPLPKKLPHIAQPFNNEESLPDQARAYLHANCAHCHRRGGGGTAEFELLYELKLKDLLLVGTKPAQGTFGIHDAENVAAGDPFRSTLYYRMAKLGRGRMPYAGSNVVDQKGLKLIHDWIKSLDTTAKPTALSDPQQDARDRLKMNTANEADMAKLLNTTSGALALLRAIDTAQIAPALHKQAIALAIAHPESQVRDLFERFVPEEQRVKRLGAVVKPAELLALAGNRERGQRVFFKQGQCSNCHRIGPEGKEIGPDLTLVGKKLDRGKILESILEPSKVIDPPYVAYQLETSAGLSLTGMVVTRSATEIVLKDTQGKVTAVSATSVDSITPLRTSLMPELLLRDLTAQEVADLLEYLQGLK